MRMGQAIALGALVVVAVGVFPARSPAQPAPPAAAPATPAVQPAAPVQASELAQPLALDPKVMLRQLPNGMRYYIRVNHEPRDRAELRLVVNAGSVLEQDDQQGLAHFVEHMAFNGTKHFKSQQLVSYLERIGMRFGADVNAHTGFDETIYELTVPTDHDATLAKAFQILEDWAHAISFDPREIDKERGVVIEEWRQRRGAGQRILDQQYPVLLHGSQYAQRLPIGQKELLESFPYEAVTRFYRQWYHPELMAVVAVGDFDAVQVERWIRKHFGAIPASKQPAQRGLVAVPSHDATLFSVVTDPEATGSRVSVTLKQPARPTTTIGDSRRDLVEQLWSGMFNARLSELTQKPDPPFLGGFAGQGSLVRGTESLTLTAQVKDNGVEPALTALLAEAARVHQHGFLATELERRKKSLLRSLEQRWQEREKTSSDEFADLYADNFLEGDPVPGIEFSYAMVQRLLPTITLDEVNALARDWTAEPNRVVLVSGPKKEGVTLPTEPQLRALFAGAASQPTEPWVDEGAGAVLVENPPTPGTIAQEQTWPELGVTRWTLSNGVQVWLKPTDFQQDEVLLASTSPGGTSLAPDATLASAQFASGIVSTGGVGALNLIELRKVLAGKSVGVSPGIGDLSEGVRGSSSVQDLTTMFELAYLYFTQPRRDPDAFTSMKSRFTAMVANRANDPDQAFSDTLSVILTQHHPRVKLMTSELVSQLDLDQAMAFYKDRFADASDFIFALAGSFQIEQIRPLVLQYLGGLPALHRHENFKDNGIRPPTGVVKREVHRGQDAKSRTQILFTGPFEWNRENRYALQALSDVLSVRLRNVLREDMGGTYGVGVSARGDRDPDPEYRVGISFGADPARLQELTDQTFQVLREMQDKGPTAEEVAKVQETQRREYETSLRENGFWLQQMLFRAQYGLDPMEILSYTKLVDALKPQTVRDAAKRYLRLDNYVQVSLLPEGAPGQTSQAP